MSQEQPRFPEYGEGGDYVGARRARRAFRYFVVATVLFTLMLAYSELYLQQEGAERLYTHALTLQDESARVLLRQAVLHDRQAQEVPTPKYLEALASREEAGKILSTYEEAFQIDKNNPSLALRYGCQLLREGRTAEAAEKFDVAAKTDPSNALPLYLKATTLPGGFETREGLSESIALIAQANNSGQRVSFPKPLWSSVLATRGRVYAALSRGIVDECSGPLYHYVQAVTARAGEDIAAGKTQYWDAWLETLQEMGDRIASSAGPGSVDNHGPAAGASLQVLLGVRIQLTAIQQRLAIIQMGGAPPNDALTARQEKLITVQAPLLAFENTRDERIAADRAGYLLSGRLFFLAFGSALLVYLVARFAWNRWGRRILIVWQETEKAEGEKAAPHPELSEVGKEPERTIRHTWSAKAIMVAGLVALLTTLFVLMALQRGGTDHNLWSRPLTVVWALELTVLFAFGMVYPWLALASPRKVVERYSGNPEHAEDTLNMARLRRRRAALCLIYRYYGVLLGLVMTVFAVWVVGYRVTTDLYPWEMPLLTTGLINEEVAAVHDALARQL